MRDSASAFSRALRSAQSFGAGDVSSGSVPRSVRIYDRLFVQDLETTIINATTDKMQRELVLDPTRNYQPIGAPKCPTNQ